MLTSQVGITSFYTLASDMNTRSFLFNQIPKDSRDAPQKFDFGRFTLAYGEKQTDGWKYRIQITQCSIFVDPNPGEIPINKLLRVPDQVAISDALIFQSDYIVMSAINIIFALQIKTNSKGLQFELLFAKECKNQIKKLFKGNSFNMFWASFYGETQTLDGFYVTDKEIAECHSFSLEQNEVIESYNVIRVMLDNHYFAVNFFFTGWSSQPKIFAVENEARNSIGKSDGCRILNVKWDQQCPEFFRKQRICKLLPIKLNNNLNNFVTISEKNRVFLLKFSNALNVVSEDKNSASFSFVLVEEILFELGKPNLRQVTHCGFVESDNSLYFLAPEGKNVTIDIFQTKFLHEVQTSERSITTLVENIHFADDLIFVVTRPKSTSNLYEIKILDQNLKDLDSFEVENSMTNQIIFYSPAMK